MMDYTDRHCRYFLRLLSPSALLYDTARLLEFHPAEHPVALQLGGSNPDELARAARAGEQFGYDEINLNCGCPSDRVQSGRFGACLMAEPTLVAECVSAMRAGVRIPVTVKCRIGIDPMPHTATDSYEFLVRFVEAVARAGCNVLVVHARRAVLNGLSPKENREIPPLQYDVVRQLRADFPELILVVNGGVRTLEDVSEHLQLFDGVMIGREAYANPYFLSLLHRAVVDPQWPLPSREAIVERYVPYVQDRLAEGHRLRSMVRHVQGLYAGLPRVRSWRRFLSERASAPDARADLLMDALRILRAAA
jgi:tRNA-dihydrouridine synthase A